MNSQQSVPKIKAAKVILYAADGTKTVFKMGNPDPETVGQVDVTIETNAGYDEVYFESLVPAAFYKTNQKTSIKLTA